MIKFISPLLLLLLTTAAHTTPVSFSKDLAPILNDKCLACHKQDKNKGGYRVDSFHQLLQPGDSEESPIQPGNPDAGLFFHRLITDDEDERMPQQDDPLPNAQIQLFKRWINEGAKFDGKDIHQPLASLLPKTTAPKNLAKYPQPLPITAITWLHDQQTLAVSGYHEITLWNSKNGTLTRRIPNMPERIFAISLHPNGKTLAVAGGSPGRSGALFIVDLPSAKIIKELPATPDTQLTATFSPNGEYLASAGAHNTIFLYQTKDWKLRWKAEAHADWVTQLAFSPDSSRLASASRDRTARAFDSSNGEVLATQTTHGNPVTSVAFDANNTRLFTAANNGEIRSCQVKADGGSIDTAVITGRRVEATRILLSPPHLLIASTDGRIRGFDITKKKDPKPLELPNYNQQRIDTLALQPDTKTLAVAGTSGSIHIINLNENKTLLTFTASPGWNQQN